jgi:hypothetical protein
MVWWKSLFQKRPLEAQLDSELRFHIEELTKANLTAGVPTNILVQFEMIELVEGFLLVFPAHVTVLISATFQHPILVSFSRSSAG